jgi:EmrB/QacA subfamily drug resistance transporter
LKARIFADENRKWWTLGAVAFGLFMIMLDNTIVNVALPSIQRDLEVGISGLEWVVNGYALTFAVLMLTGGKLADLYGRRLIFIVGLAVFTAASLACGLATSDEWLIAARIVQGAGAALMNPATLSIITATFPPRQRGMAIGIWAGVSALALAIGPLVGGVIAEHIHWGWIFFINVPVGILAIVVARLVIDESRDTSAEQRLDFPGLFASAVGLFALTYGLIEANTYGWTSTRILALFGVAAAALVAFVVLELRQRLPMLDLNLFRNSTFAGANTVMMLVALAMFGVFFFVSLFVQNILGYSATEAGATFLPMTVLVILVAPAAGKMSDRVGSRWLMGGGMVSVAISLLVFSRLDAGSDFWDLLPGLLVGGLGMGLAMTPTTSAAMGSVPIDKAGVGSAVLNSMRQVGGALGIAVMGAIVTSHVDLSARPGPETASQFVAGFQDALLVASGIAFAAAIVAVTTVRTYRHAEPGALAEGAAG